MGGGFGRVWTAATVSGFGSYVTGVALQVLLVVTLSASATELGIVGAAQWLPYLLFGLLAGVFIDRHRRRGLIAATDFGRGALLLAIPVLAALGLLRVWVVVVFLLPFGVLSLLGTAANQAYLPRLVPAADLTRANVALERSGIAAQTVGPAIAGGLVRLIGAPLAVLVDAASYLVSGALVASIRTPEPVPDRAGRRRIRTELAEGLRFVYRHRTLAPYALGTHVWFVATAMASTLWAPYVLRQAGLGSVGLGVTLAVAGVGGVVGNTLGVRLGHRIGAGGTVVVGRWVSPLAFGLVALVPPTGALGWVVALAGQALFGLGMGIDGPMESAYRQTVTPDALQGRMNATIRSLNWGLRTVGAPLGGVLGDHLGYRPAFAVATAIYTAAALAMTLSPYRTARLPTSGAAG